MKKMQEAAITEMIVDNRQKLPVPAEPLTKVDKITMYGEGNAKIVGDIVQY